MFRFQTVLFFLACLFVFTGTHPVHAQTQPFRLAVGIDTSGTSGIYNHSSGSSIRLGFSYDFPRPEKKSLGSMLYLDVNLSDVAGYVGVGYGIRTVSTKRASSPYAGAGLGLYGPLDGGVGFKLLAGYETAEALFIETNITLVGSEAHPAFVIGLRF